MISQKLTRLLCTVLICALPLPALCQSFPSLAKTIELARSEAYRTKHVDWPAVEAQSLEEARKNGEESAIRLVLKSLGDTHSSYRALSSPQQQSNSSPRPRIEIAELKFVNEMPVVRINAWSGSPQEANDAAATVRALIAKSLENQSCGIVLDFSTNHGGNMWPMVVGLSPLYTNGTLGFFRDRNGNDQLIEKRNGFVYLDERPHYLNYSTDQQPNNLAQRIGIVIGPRTASSGEITAILFHAQPNTKFFGKDSSGYSTANRTFKLANGGTVAITTGTTLDRNQQEYGGKIIPDVITQLGLEDAAKWVQSGCTGSGL